MSLQHVYECCPDSIVATDLAGAKVQTGTLSQPIDKSTVSGSRPVFKQSIVLSTTQWNGMFAAPVQVLAAPPNGYAYLVKGFSVSQRGTPGYTVFNNLASPFIGFANPALNTQASFTNGVTANFVAPTAATGGPVGLSYGSSPNLASLQATNIIPVAAFLTANSVGVGYASGAGGVTMGLTGAQPSPVTGVAIYISNETAAFTGDAGLANRYVITVEYQLIRAAGP